LAVPDKELNHYNSNRLSVFSSRDLKEEDSRNLGGVSPRTGKPLELFDSLVHENLDHMIVTSYFADTVTADSGGGEDQEPGQD